ncbi:MAG: thiamine pyrophosphate-binding protein [Alphaproteobacteria bacterium]|nr:thiamine pyrophosphate-binding protein [Alphaproteobacteria bacterium]
MTDSEAKTGGVGLRTADIIGRRLYQAGVRAAFGIPGGEVLSLVDGLEKAGIDFLLAKHENAAGFMAEGTHHLSGAPGVLVATVGPGAANAVNVTANAEQDRVPLIVLTGCVDPADTVTYNHQVFDHRAVFAPICKASFTVPDGNVAALIDKAIAIATEGRPGPVHLDVPIAVAAQIHDAPLPTPRVPRAPVAPAEGPDLETARRWLAEAERPLVIAGVDAVNGNAGEAITEFAKAFGAPVIASYKAKGLIADDEAMSLGGAGLSPLADKTLMPMIKDADYILLAGYDPIEMRAGWRDPWDAADKRVVELLAAPEYSYMHQAPISFVCDINEGIRAVSTGVTTRPTWPDSAPAKARQTLAGAYGQNEAWGPAAITTTIRKVAPRDTVVTVDSGAHRILLSQVWESFVPHAVLQSTGLCTMGCALPLATGAKLAAPERPVIAFTGDGGLEMVLGELVTLRDLKLPVVVVVFVDASLALIEKKQREMSFANAGVDMTETDFETVAKALGGNGVTVEDRGALEAAMRDALRADTYTVIAAKIPRGSYDGRI